ncbi:MAG: DUF4203 domain-containing protein [Acidobacteriota bacterium]|nr:DUF4203 domain-containing protein [Acidobacteriota bacterium]
MPESIAAVDTWLPAALGVVLILFGRKLFWLLLGTLGFLIAFRLVTQFADDTPELMVWVLAGGVGVAGAVAAIFLQRIAAGVAGLLFGGYAVMWLLDFYAVGLGNIEWLIVLVGAVVAAALAVAVLEETLMVLSSILGAALLVAVSGLDAVAGAIFFVALVIVGITAQKRSNKKKE